MTWFEQSAGKKHRTVQLGSDDEYVSFVNFLTAHVLYPPGLSEPQKPRVGSRRYSLAPNIAQHIQTPTNYWYVAVDADRLDSRRQSSSTVSGPARTCITTRIVTSQLTPPICLNKFPIQFSSVSLAAQRWTIRDGKK